MDLVKNKSVLLIKCNLFSQGLMFDANFLFFVACLGIHSESGAVFHLIL
jgi:hypothetical protein